MVSYQPLAHRWLAPRQLTLTRCTECRRSTLRIVDLRSREYAVLQL